MVRQKILFIFICVLSGYLIGCFNPAVIVGKIKGYDPKQSGSGNAGASNTVIMAGKLAGLSVALIDILKAFAACHLAKALFPALRIAPIAAGVACILGHIYPVFLRFRGGKGLACLGGVILAYDPMTFLLMLATALAIALLTNYVCIVTPAMALIWPAYYAYLTRFWVGAAAFFIPFLPILLKHMSNFKRIRTGEELRLSYLWNKSGELKRIGRSEE